MNTAQYYLTQLLRLTVPEPLSPKAHQGTREQDRRLKQRYHLAAKQALRGDARIRIAR